MKEYGWWDIVNTTTNKVVQTELGKQRASRDMGYLNDHEIRCGRTPIYELRYNRDAQ